MRGKGPEKGRPPRHPKRGKYEIRESRTEVVKEGIGLLELSGKGGRRVAWTSYGEL